MTKLPNWTFSVHCLSYDVPYPFVMPSLEHPASLLGSPKQTNRGFRCIV